MAVRAVVSRLRRSIGGLLATQPYRFAGGMAVEVLEADPVVPRA